MYWSRRSLPNRGDTAILREIHTKMYALYNDELTTKLWYMLAEHGVRYMYVFTETPTQTYRHPPTHTQYTHACVPVKYIHTCTHTRTYIHIHLVEARDKIAMLVDEADDDPCIVPSFINIRHMWLHPREHDTVVSPSWLLYYTSHGSIMSEAINQSSNVAIRVTEIVFSRRSVTSTVGGMLTATDVGRVASLARHIPGLSLRRRGLCCATTLQTPAGYNGRLQE